MLSIAEVNKLQTALKELFPDIIEEILDYKLDSLRFDPLATTVYIDRIDGKIIKVGVYHGKRRSKHFYTR